MYVLYGMDFSFINLIFIDQFQASSLKEGSRPIRTGVTGEEVKQRVVQSAGMFATAKRIYTSFSSIRRPSADFVVQQFKDLEKDGLGVTKTANRSSIFFKRIPEFLINEEHKLGKLNTTVEEYKTCFAQVDG